MEANEDFTFSEVAYFFKPCSLANALAMADPEPAAGGEV